MGLPPVHAVSDGELVNDSGWVLRWTVQFQRGTTVPQGPEFIRNLLSAPERCVKFLFAPVGCWEFSRSPGADPDQMIRTSVPMELRHLELTLEKQFP